MSEKKAEKQAVISRRQALRGIGGAALASSAGVGLASPALANDARGESITWKMVTSWPKDLPGPGVSARRIAEAITTMSGGRLTVQLFAAGEIVPAFEVLDAVSSGTAQMGHSASLYWQGKMPAAAFFCTVPFGLLPHEHVAWIEQGGGQQLWEELYAPFGVQPYMAGNTGPTMGGWFRKEIASPADLKGVKIRAVGMGGEVLRRLGAQAISLPSSELYAGFQSGVVDAVEFLGPWTDSALGFQRIGSHYYGPGVNKPNGTGEALINKKALSALPEDLRAVVAAACRMEADRALAEANQFNATALAKLQETDGLHIAPFPVSVQEAYAVAAAEVMAEYAKSDAMSAKVFASYEKARTLSSGWSDMSLAQNLGARALMP
ncbi:TRAP transporter substrate-binding protein [Polycladidibacter hongkongensis]|uniref:TRAP transporter substrate-binding protein n=1 Tax=Polycladidibacter hongkongensis TaxID=1647556 RepID=UPI0008352DC5|nr:TRAP transporter substrate-binding protein [Pseudovibrio hongkongensis]